MLTFKQSIRDLIAPYLAQAVKRFAFDPKYFDLWQSRGFHVKPVGFYSPLPDTNDLLDDIWQHSSDMSGLDWNEARQLEILNLFHDKYHAEYSQFLTQKIDEKPKFHFGNSSFEAVDAELLYCMIRHFKPRRIVEIGSGYSSLLALDALAQNIKNGCPGTFTAIEPFPPQFLHEELPVPIELLVQPVQSVSLDFFSSLESGDILFIDSSHVCKIGSDVQYEFLEILPRLAPGVIVHVHDIFLPVEYPKHWVKDWHRFWNEQYILQAFLCFNDTFDVLWGGSFMHLHHQEKLANAFGSYDPQKNWPASFWMQKSLS